MSLVMTSLMTFKMTSKTKLYTDKDFDVERVFEIKIVDKRARNEVKQKSFSVMVKKGTKDNEYPKTEKVRDFLDEKIREM